MDDEPRQSRISRFAVGLGGVSLLALASAGPLHRAGVVTLAGAFAVLKYALIGSLATLLLAAAALIIARRRRTAMSAAVAAMALSLAALGAVATLAWQASRVPAIHDVTTDTIQPPPFLALVPLRAGAPNPVEHGGAPVVARQRAAYPDIAPLLLPDPPDRAFERALAAARTMGWELVASDPVGGRIEATDTTFWFGFKDDVVIRVTPQPTGCRVDMRSLSRVGGGDLGANAARIRKYFATVKGT